MKKISILFLLYCVIGIGFLTNVQASPVIVSKASGASEMTVNEIKKIFQGKKSGWETIELKKGNELREQFSQAIFGKSAEEMDRYYMKRSISGKGQPPRIAENTAEVKTLVAVGVKTIGYVEERDTDSSVTIVYRF